MCSGSAIRLRAPGQARFFMIDGFALLHVVYRIVNCGSRPLGGYYRRQSHRLDDAGVAIDGGGKLGPRRSGVTISKVNSHVL